MMNYFKRANAQTRKRETGKPAILKLLAMGLAITMASSCTKEEAVKLQPTPQFLGGSNLAFEYYEPQGDLEEAIREALISLEDDGALDVTSLNRGIWILETGVNYLFGDEVYIFEDQRLDSMTYNMDLYSGDQVHESEIKDAVIELYNSIDGVLSLNDGFRIAGVNVFVKEKTSSLVSLGVYVAYLTGVTGSIDDPETNNCIPSADGTRLAFPANYCNSDPAITARKHAADRALVCLRKYWGPDPYAPPFGRKYYTNVINYSSIHNTAAFISPNQLLGHSSSPFTAHQSPVPFNTCLTVAEQNTYADIIHSQVSLILNKPFGVISLTMDSKTYTGSLCDWQYNNVFIGENGFWTLTPLVLSLSYL